MSVKLETGPAYKKTMNYLQSMEKLKSIDFNKYGAWGVELLKASTPKDTGKTSESWSYKIERSREGIKMSWHNSNENDGVPIAMLIQYGHATPSGKFIKGRDYINPAMDGLMELVISDLRREFGR